MYVRSSFLYASAMSDHADQLPPLPAAHVLAPNACGTAHSAATRGVSEAEAAARRTLVRGNWARASERAAACPCCTFEADESCIYERRGFGPSIKTCKHLAYDDDYTLVWASD